MKILKRVLLVLAILVVLPLIIALFVNKNYSIEKEITINQPVDVVFNYVKQLKNQDNFGEWTSIDPNMKRTYFATDGITGFVLGWESEVRKIGTGEMEIKNISRNNRIDYEIRFIKPCKSTENAYMTTQRIDRNSTLVKWGISGSKKYPKNLSLLFTNLNKKFGRDFESGLNRLKQIFETPQEMPAQANPVLNNDTVIQN